MRAEDRDPHTGGRHSDIREIHNLSGLVHHLKLFLGVPIIAKNIDLRNKVEEYLVIDFFRGGDRKALAPSLRLLLKIFDPFLSSSRNRLISRDPNRQQFSFI